MDLPEPRRTPGPPPAAVAVRHDSPQLAITPGTIAALLKRPLLALPPEVRGEALVVWTCHKHLKGFESPLPLSAALSVWISRHGLTPDDAVAALGACLAPAAMLHFTYSSELMTHLAGAAAAAVGRRRAEAEAAAARGQAADDEANAADPTEVRAMVESLFPPPEDF